MDVIGQEPLRNVAGSELVEGLAFPLLVLAPVLVELDRPEPVGQGTKGAPGADLGQLPGVADKDQQGPRRRGRVNEAAHGPRADHPGLVDHYNIARAKDAGRSVELAQEPGQGDRGNAGCDLKFLGGPGAERSAGDDIAGRFEDLAGDGQAP